MDAATQALLQNLIRRESRSLLQYVHESYPWTTPAAQSVLAQVEQMVAERRSALAALARMLTKRHVPPPFLGPYPMNFTNVNFVTLDYLLPLLVAQEQRNLAALEKDLERIGDAEIHAEVQGMVEMNRRHLHELTEMASHKIADGQLQTAI